jgi:hypothetical protein
MGLAGVEGQNRALASFRRQMKAVHPGAAPGAALFEKAFGFLEEVF